MKDLKKLKPANLADGVEDSLLEYIRRRGLGVGDALPKEEEIAQQMNVSRNIIREGVSRLKTYGLIESRRRRGMVLSRPDAFAGVSKLARARIFSPEEQYEFMQMRIIMELGMTDFIYEMKTPEDIAALREIASGSSTAEPDDLIMNEVAFHDRLFSIGGNRVASRFQQILSSAFASVKSVNRDNAANVISHLRICDVLENGSCHEFHDVMRDHFSPYMISKTSCQSFCCEEQS